MSLQSKKSNILAFCYEFPPIGGGAGNALFHMAREWVLMGHTVTVVTTGYEALPKDSVFDGVRVLRLSCGRKRMSQGRVGEMVRFMLQSSLKIKMLYKHFCPDICIAFMGVPSGLGPLLMRYFYKVPYITALRGGDVPGFDPDSLRTFHFLSRGLIRLIWKHSQHLVANSAGLVQLAHEFDTSKHIQSIPNGVDILSFLPNPNKKQTHTLRMIFVGRFAESQKQVSMLIRALNELTGVELWLVGDGADKAKYEALVEELSLNDRVVFAGWLKGKSLVDAYHAADIYVSASRYEGMPNAVLEAMACGLIPILSNIAGHNELVRHGGGGFLFNLYDLMDLVRCLEVLRNDSSLRANLSKRSRQAVLDRFQWQAIARGYEKLFFNHSEGVTSSHAIDSKQN